MNPHCFASLRVFFLAGPRAASPARVVPLQIPSGMLVWLLVLCGALVAAPSPEAVAQNKPEKPVAVVGTDAIYEKDYLPQIQGQLYKMRKQEYELRRKAIEDVINRRLLRQEAEKKGMAETELLRQEADSKAAEPTEEEVEQNFVAQMFRNGGQISLSKDQIREQLQQRAVQQGREDYFQQLRQQAGVKIYFLPPAVEVGYDPSRVRGNPDAIITIVEFSDFQCPYCLQAYGMMKNLLKKYDGKVKLAYRDLPLQEVQSKIPGAAEASRCAGEQDRFWEYHDLLFENSDSHGEAEFREFAAELQLNLDQFNACLESGKFKSRIQEDFQEAIRLGATGTPAIFINGVFVNGAPPQAEFEEIIDAQLAALEP